ncbi:MAG: DNA-directed DNA polymerase II small subunit [Candidatus Micrarchaeota archaeon]
MDAKSAVKELQEKGYMVTAEAFEKITNSNNPEELARAAMKCAGEKTIIDLSCFDIVEKGKDILKEKKVEIEYTEFKPTAKEYETRLKVLSGANMGIESTGKVENFVNYFRDRYTQISQMYASRGGNSLVPLNKLKLKKNVRTRIIGIVSEKRTTKNGHILLNVEDLDCEQNVLIPSSNKKLIEYAGSLVDDEVICIDGRMSSELYIADSISQPDMPIKQPKKIEEDIALLTTSDMHIGSKMFVQNSFEKFIRWLAGKEGDEKQRELAGKVKYVSIAGDLVDGIGIYPGQESELDILDIFAQYDAFEKYLEQIPDYVQVIISPGNHDAVRNADPQPVIPEDLLRKSYKMSNVTLVGSPATVSVHGINTLIYHGTSFDDIIARVPAASYEKSESPLIECLKRRHLHPIYGGKPITPSVTDTLVINEIPDIFHAGHIHKNGYDIYRGVTCINSGTFQQITPYQVKQGHKPTPGIVPVVELKNGKIRVMHFDKDE